MFNCDSSSLLFGLLIGIIIAWIMTKKKAPLVPNYSDIKKQIYLLTRQKPPVITKTEEIIEEPKPIGKKEVAMAAGGGAVGMGLLSFGWNKLSSLVKGSTSGPTVTSADVQKTVDETLKKKEEEYKKVTEEVKKKVEEIEESRKPNTLSDYVDGMETSSSLETFTPNILYKKMSIDDVNVYYVNATIPGYQIKVVSGKHDPAEKTVTIDFIWNSEELNMVIDYKYNKVNTTNQITQKKTHVNLIKRPAFLDKI